MAHFAEVKNTDNKVLRVVVISNDDVNSNGGDYSSDAEVFVRNLLGNTSVTGGTYWKQCSYNTIRGVHYTQEDDGPVPSEDQTRAFRLNFPGRGWAYDESANAFYSPRPVINGQLCNSWTLDTSTGMWEPPIPLPEGDITLVEWDESTTSWVPATPNNINS